MRIVVVFLVLLGFSLSHHSRIADAGEGVAMDCPPVVIQPGPEGKDTGYGTVYARNGMPDHPVMYGGGWGDFYYNFYEFDLSGAPPSSAVDSVFFDLYITYTENDPTYQVMRVTEPWTEIGLTYWNNPASTFFTNFPAITTPGWYSVDITDLYKAWMDGAFPNYGIKLSPTKNNRTNAAQATSDNPDPSIRPRLVVTTVRARHPVEDLTSVRNRFGQVFVYDRHVDSRNLQKYAGKRHLAIDYGIGVGTGVYPFAAGTVCRTREIDAGDYGRYVIVKHTLPDASAVFSLYAHLGRILVKVGDDVCPHQVIAESGDTGGVRAHLHFAVFQPLHDPAARGICTGAQIPKGYSTREFSEEDEWVDYAGFRYWNPTLLIESLR
jgi:murein DD-endopeptidase MepM/ murein hydrolase activator NlpD